MSKPFLFYYFNFLSHLSTVGFLEWVSVLYETPNAFENTKEWFVLLILVLAASNNPPCLDISLSRYIKCSTSPRRRLTLGRCYLHGPNPLIGSFHQVPEFSHNFLYILRFFKCGNIRKSSSTTTSNNVISTKTWSIRATET